MTISSTSILIFGTVMTVALFIVGIMSVHEGMKDQSADTSTNNGLLVVASLVNIVACLCVSVIPYMLKNNDVELLPAYLALLMSLYGLVNGTLGIICAVETPNNKAWTDSLLVMGAISIVAGVVPGAVLWGIYINSWLH
jgi:hypothetical protein